MLDNESKKLVEELLFSEKKKPSFAKQLFFGRFDSASVIPYPEPSAQEKKEVDQYIKELKRFAEQHMDPVKIDRQAKIPPEVISGLGELGLLSLTIPKEYGGRGMSQYAYCRAMEEIAGICASTALFINAHQSVGLKALLLFGTEEQKSKWLPKLSKGKSLAAFALTEPNAGSDAGGIETRAVFDPVRQVYTINGRKQWITNGSIADILTVMAKTEVDTPRGKEDKVTAFIVTPDMKGFKVIEKALDKVGMRGSTTSILEFDNVVVPAANILGPKGGGLKVCLTVLDFGRTTFGATCTGVAKEAIRLARHQAINRHQFKRPLGSFALVKQKITDMYAMAYAMESTTYLTAGLVDHVIEDFMLETAIVKVFNSDALWNILYDTMQIYGGRSFFTDSPLERMMRDARLNMIGEGSNEVLRAFIGAVGMRDVGMELKGIKENFGSQWTNGFKLGKQYLMAPKIPITSTELQSEASELGELVRDFGWAVFKTLAKYREEVVEKQLVLNRLAEAVMAIYTVTAVLSRMEAELKSGRISALDLKLGKYYCTKALAKGKRFLKMLNGKNDELVEELADEITGIKR